MSVLGIVERLRSACGWQCLYVAKGELERQGNRMGTWRYIGRGKDEVWRVLNPSPTPHTHTHPHTLREQYRALYLFNSFYLSFYWPLLVSVLLSMRKRTPWALTSTTFLALWHCLSPREAPLGHIVSICIQHTPVRIHEVSNGQSRLVNQSVWHNHRIQSRTQDHDTKTPRRCGTVVSLTKVISVAVHA